MKNIKINRKIIIVCGIVLLLFIGLFLFSRNHLSKLEKDLLLEDSNNIIYYLDTIDNGESKEIDSYILFALDYAYNEEDKESLTSKEIKKIIETYFDKKVTTKEINRIGVTPLLLDRSVMHNPEEEIYSIDRGSITQRQIADIPIVVYKRKSTKKSNNKYIVKYQKVTIKNPYEILNYYSDLNQLNSEIDSNNKKKSKKKEIENYDISKIMNYLTAKGKMKDIKEAVNDEIIKKEGEVSKKLVTVTYVLKGTHFVVSSIK